MGHNAVMWDAHVRAEVHAAPSGDEAPATPEQLRRLQRLQARALEVFASRVGASVWCHSPNEHACGRWTSPWALAREGETGCRRVLAELDRIDAVLRCRSGWDPLVV